VLLAEESGGGDGDGDGADGGAGTGEEEEEDGLGISDSLVDELMQTQVRDLLIARLPMDSCPLPRVSPTDSAPETDLPTTPDLHTGGDRAGGVAGGAR